LRKPIFIVISQRLPSLPALKSYRRFREVAEHLRVSTRTVYKLCEEGELAHVRIMNAIRVEPAALVALVKARGVLAEVSSARDRRMRQRP